MLSSLLKKDIIMKNEKYTYFLKGPLSQWSKSPFIVGGIWFSCAEQFMMAEKAKLFGDEETLAKIMATSSPKKQQDLGREVKNFNEDVWNEHARAIVFAGNLVKFTQNPEHLKVLLATEGTTLVEVNPRDQIWGIGLDADDPKILNEETWEGKNWLGEVLTNVRDQLLNDKHYQTMPFDTISS